MLSGFTHHIYSNGMPDNVNSFLYNGLIEELVDVLELQNSSLIIVYELGKLIGRTALNKAQERIKEFFRLIGKAESGSTSCFDVDDNYTGFCIPDTGCLSK